MATSKKAQKRYRAKKKRKRAEADKLWHKAGMKKWGEVCTLSHYPERASSCKRTADECHHFKPKGAYGHLRYDLDNAVPLCRFCHCKLEHDSSLAGLIIEQRGEEWHQRLLGKARNRKKTSFTTLGWYEGHIKRLKEYSNEEGKD